MKIHTNMIIVKEDYYSDQSQKIYQPNTPNKNLEENNGWILHLKYERRAWALNSGASWTNNGLEARGVRPNFMGGRHKRNT